MSLDSTIPVVAAFIQEGNTYLIAQRAKGELAGKWEFPGGKIEKGETAEQALIREIHEELGIYVKVLDHIADFDHTYPFAKIHLSFYECSLPEFGTIRPSSSHSAITWISSEPDINCNGSIDIPDFAPLDKKIYRHIITHQFERLFLK